MDTLHVPEYISYKCFVNTVERNFPPSVPPSGFPRRFQDPLLCLPLSLPRHPQVGQGRRLQEQGVQVLHH